jgi:hypothetical protein
MRRVGGSFVAVVTGWIAGAIPLAVLVLLDGAASPPSTRMVEVWTVTAAMGVS